MTEIVRFEAGGGEVLVEVDEPQGVGLQRVARGKKRIVQAAASLDEAIDTVLPAAGRMFEALESLKPAAAELEFGVKLSGTLGGVLAKAAGEAHLNVTLKWEPHAAAGGREADQSAA